MIPRSAIQRAFEEYVSENRDPESGQKPDYRWDAVTTDGEPGEITVQLAFRKGRSYCCYEPCCHVGIRTADDWDRLRTLLSREGATVPSSLLSVRLRVVVETGAEFHAYPAGCGGVSGGLAFERAYRESSS